MIKKIVLLFTVLILVSCGDENKVENDIAAIDVDFVVERFDIAFANSNSSDLPKLKAAYPFMFSKRYDDAFWLQKINDTIQQELAYETQEVFKDFKTPKEEIVKLFQHLKYYNPNFEIPRVITTTSSVDYRNKVIVTDTIALISIDTYLGNDHKFYEGIQKYIRENFTKDQIVVDLANAYAEEVENGNHIE